MYSFLSMYVSDYHEGSVFVIDQTTPCLTNKQDSQSIRGQAKLTGTLQAVLIVSVAGGLQ